MFTQKARRAFPVPDLTRYHRNEAVNFASVHSQPSILNRTHAHDAGYSQPIDGSCKVGYSVSSLKSSDELM